MISISKLFYIDVYGGSNEFVTLFFNVYHIYLILPKLTLLELKTRSFIKGVIGVWDGDI